MRAFQNLFNQLDQVTGTKAKVQALVDHFHEIDPGEAAWAFPPHSALAPRQTRQ
ncbi:hypothetical protein [Parasynechococcus sp.]|uniref:hypothetical protein n=1 Tax=Parasynechococcus sp. TaxID=3101203 RepID=UPI0037040B2E